MERDLITTLDYETNGFQGSDVLSMSLRHSDGTEVERFYYPEGEYNESAIKVNGLTEEKITELRGDADYPRLYKDDQEAITDMFKQTDTLVAHNVSFDYSFLPQEVKDMDLKIVDTMKANTKYFDKNPKLSEASEHYGLKVESENLHGSSYDTKLAQDIYNKMSDQDKIPNKDYLTKDYAGKNEKGEMVHPYGSMKGMTSSDIAEKLQDKFFEKYDSAAKHEMFEKVASEVYKNEMQNMVTGDKSVYTEKALNALANSEQEHIRSSVASSSVATESVLDKLSRDENSAVRATVGLNASTSPDTLDRLSFDKSEAVRDCVLSNPNTSKETRDKLYSIKEVADTAKNDFISANVKNSMNNSEKNEVISKGFDIAQGIKDVYAKYQEKVSDISKAPEEKKGLMGQITSDLVKGMGDVISSGIISSNLSSDNAFDRYMGDFFQKLDKMGEDQSLGKNLEAIGSVVKDLIKEKVESVVSKAQEKEATKDAEKILKAENSENLQDSKIEVKTEAKETEKTSDKEVVPEKELKEIEKDSKEEKVEAKETEKTSDKEVAPDKEAKTEDKDVDKKEQTDDKNVESKTDVEAEKTSDKEVVPEKESKEVEKDSKEEKVEAKETENSSDKEVASEKIDDKNVESKTDVEAEKTSDKETDKEVSPEKESKEEKSETEKPEKPEKQEENINDKAEESFYKNEGSEHKAEESENLKEVPEGEDKEILEKEQKEESTENIKESVENEEVLEKETESVEKEESSDLETENEGSVESQEVSEEVEAELSEKEDIEEFHEEENFENIELPDLEEEEKTDNVELSPEASTEEARREEEEVSSESNNETTEEKEIEKVEVTSSENEEAKLSSFEEGLKEGIENPESVSKENNPVQQGYEYEEKAQAEKANIAEQNNEMTR